jgi:hypothetical protein
VIIDDEATKSAVYVRFLAYEIALETNDVAALDGFFWHSDLAIRFGANESLFGFSAIAAFRAGRGGVKPRRLQSTQITCFGTDHAVATTEFIREDDPRLGRQSQVWVKFPEAGWLIVSAHVSWQA